MVFNKDWFKQHQKTLLFLLNSRVFKHLFRRILRIDLKDDILAIIPNAIFIKGEKENEYKAEFRGHDKYSKRLYYGFKYLWYVVHAWDLFVANKFNPKFNLGFDTLTVYPNSGSGGTTGDCYISYVGSGASFSTMRNSSVGMDVNNTSTDAKCAGVNPDSTSNTWRYLHRGIFTFDTSALTSGANISSATISLMGQSKANAQGSPDLHIVPTTPSTNYNFQLSDYNKFTFSSVASVSYASFSTSAYNNMSLNAGGISNISKTGISKFGCITSWDLNNSFTGTWAFPGETYFWISLADSSGTSNDPKLTITFALGSPASFFSMFF